MALSNEVAETIIDIITAETHYFSLHTADPGKTGANETTVVDRTEIDPYDWSGPEDDPSTGGRRVLNINQISWGNADGIETLTHLGAWTAEVGGDFKGGWPLVSSFTTVNDKQVFAPENQLQVIGH